MNPLRIRTAALTAATCALFLATGCGDGELADPTETAAGALTEVKGIDYAFGRPSPSVLRSQGYKFVARYLSYDSGKNLSGSEARALRSAGVDVVVVWEAGGTDALNGYNEGRSQAQAAESQAKALGMPAGRPIYFAVDFDASAGQQGALNSYFDGVASVLGRGRTGVYAGYYPVKRLFDAGKVGYAWQTYAWSGGQWDNRAQLRQVHNGITVDGVDCDLDEAVHADFGQWGYAGGSSPSSPPSGGKDRITVGSNSDGRLEVFYTDQSSQLKHVWEQVKGGWSNLTPLSGKGQEVAVASNQDGRLEVFYIGTDNHLYHHWEQTGGWSGQSELGGQAKQIAVGRNADGRLELFYVGTDDKLYHNWQKTAGGAWNGQNALGGSAKQLSVTETQDGRLAVVYVGTDDHIYFNEQTHPNGGWVGQKELDGKARQVRMLLNRSNGLEVFYIGTDGKLYHNWQQASGSWAGQHGLGGAAQEIAVDQNADGRLELFYIGTDSKLYHVWEHTDGSWSGQAALGGSAKHLTVGKNSDGRLEIFYIGTNEALYHNWQTKPNGAWNGQGQL
jgi:hypothetical protein